MQEIMSRVQLNHVLHALFTALLVHANALQVLGRRTAQEPEIRAPEDGELAERLLGAGLIVSKSFRPQVLVIPGQHRTIVSQHHAQAITPDELRIGEVLHDLPDRPLPRPLRRFGLAVGQSFESSSQTRLRGAKHFQRVLGADEIQDGRRVCPSVLDRAGSGIGKH